MNSISFYFCVFLFSLFSVGASAHPHNWITLSTEFKLDEKNQLIGIKQHWEFDIYYSTIRLEEINTNYSQQQNGLDAIAKEMALNLAAFDFFSELTIDEQQIKLPSPDDASLAIINAEAQDLLRLTMAFSLKKPIAFNNKALSWRVFDPTYYIDMKHNSKTNITISQPNSSACNSQLESAEPTIEMIQYAMNLDRTQKGIQDLGSYFAEQVTISCP